MERFWEDTWPSRPFAKDPPHPSDMRQHPPPCRTIRCCLCALRRRARQRRASGTRPRVVPPSDWWGHSPYDPAPA
eukprot:scaffold2818_cov141-Isochrysis_galbana.AAC.2